MKILFYILLIFFPFSAFAEEVSTASECKMLKDHVPQNDVAYKSGVDISGKAVVPADINSPVIDVPETIVVPLSIDLAKRINPQSPNIEGLEELDATLGFLEISKNGRVTYNGTDVTPQVYTLCGLGMTASEDGQTIQDNIKSDKQTHESKE